MDDYIAGHYWCRTKSPKHAAAIRIGIEKENIPVAGEIIYLTAAKFSMRDDDAPEPAGFYKVKSVKQVIDYIVPGSYYTLGPTTRITVELVEATKSPSEYIIEETTSPEGEILWALKKIT